MLLDDELPGLTYLKMLCEQIPELEVIRTFNNPRTFLKALPGLEFDFCILDVEMPEFNGLHIATLLEGKPVVFITAYRQYAAEAFDLDAADYVVKPVRKDRLQEAVKKVAARLGEKARRPEFVQLQTHKGKTLLFFEQLAYVRTADVDSRDKIAYLKDGTQLVLKNISFDKLTALLPEDRFCRINKKELIALNCVGFFSHDEITTKILQPDGAPLVLTVSGIFREQFLKKVEN